MARQSLSRYLPWLVTAPLALVAWPLSPWASAVFSVLFVLGWLDFQQTKQAVRRNYPPDRSPALRTGIHPARVAAVLFGKR